MNTQEFSSPALLGHVYVVDDNVDLSHHLRDLLLVMGYSVEVFNSADAFLAHDANISPAVLVVDMHMPGKTGKDLQLELAKRGQTIPMVFISGGSYPYEIDAALQRGAIGFLTKPFNRHALGALLSKGLSMGRGDVPD